MAKYGQLITAIAPVVVYFHAEWHDECNKQKPLIRDIAAELGDKVKVVLIDVDRNQQLADCLKITALPVVMVYKDAENILRQNEQIDKQAIIKKVTGK